ncbi:MAG: hypothetical protein ACJ8GN_30285 [Longimicrobiaceae bacterium]
MRFRSALPLAAAILLSLAACSEWAVRPLPPGPQPTRIAGKMVRVTRIGGEVLNLSTAEVRGDSLYGIRVYSVGTPFVTLPLSEVTRLEVEQTNTTIPGLVGGAAVVVFLRWMFLSD